MSDFTEALADRRVWQIEPGLIMRPFHQPITGMEQTWHVYCSAHPDFGFCGVEGEASREALRHGNHHSPASTPDV